MHSSLGTLRLAALFFQTAFSTVLWILQYPFC